MTFIFIQVFTAFYSQEWLPIHDYKLFVFAESVSVTNKDCSAV